MKRCFECEVSKPLAEFYAAIRMADGHSGKCKTCTKTAVIANRLKRVDKYRAYDRRRGSRSTAEDTRRYREENPKKYKAHVKVGNAIRDKKLLPAPCEVCNASEVHGHHDDYDKPLTVRWLCAEHHKAWHLEHGEGANAH